MGPWKLVENYEDGSVQLFNLDEDLGEQQDRADEQPERVERMRDRLHAWYRAVDARFLQPVDGGPTPWRPAPDSPPSE
jgi:hypothetical protein